MRILVCGGRKFADYNLLAGALLSLFPPPTDDMSTWLPPAETVIIHGGAPGADSLADQWAVANWVQVEEFKADWEDLSHPDAIIRVRKDGAKYDAKAGLRRNQKMIDEGRPDFGVALPGGTGTADMVRRLKKAMIPGIMVLSDEKQIRF